MSLETILPIPLIPWVDGDVQINLGSVGKTSWSLRPIWENEGGLENFDILRTTSAGRVEFEVNLTHTYDNYEDIEEDDDKSFSGCLEDGYTMFRVKAYGWPHKIEDFRGKVHGSVTLFKDYSIKCSKCGTRTQSKKLPSSFSYLSDDFLMLFRDFDHLADGTLKCGTAEFPVHKLILKVRCPVLASKFKSETQDSCEMVDISDIKPNVLMYTLKYIYSGKTDNLSRELAADLIVVAENYALEELKLMCAEVLKLNTTVENVSRMLVLGHLHDSSLKAQAKEIVCKYDTFSDIESTEEWKVLEDKYPKLAIEVIKSVVEYLQKKK